jgi:hypothetical protein
MIIKKEGYVEDKLVQSAERIAIRFGLEIKRDENKFTLAEAIEEDYWFDPKTFTIDQLEEFIQMCQSYKADDYITKIPMGKCMEKVDCPSCRTILMTHKQKELNTIIIEGKKHMVCISCAELMELDS